ncbi:MAG: glycosyltransferase family 4 protein, partial [Syntrophobacteraceae bacterium]|nr:glycosyltransferase family 4 protein [Syntrophobacteraceae bacterium]
MNKIILVAYELNPRLGSEAGVSNIWLNILSKFYHVVVFTNISHKKDIEKFQYFNVDFNYINLSDNKVAEAFKRLRMFNLVNSMFASRVKRRVKNLLSKDKYLLIHCISPQGIHSYNDLYKLGVPVIVGPVGGGLRIPEGFERLETKKYKIRNWFYSMQKFNYKWIKYFKNAKRIVIGTQYVKNCLPPSTSAKQIIIYDSVVDIQYFKPVERKKRNLINILYCGRMDINKGCTLLYETYQRLIGNEDFRRKTRLNFVGAGTLLQVMRQWVMRDNLVDNVRIYGRVSKERVLECLSEADIFCAPTLREPGGNAILEAMCCELPIITADYGGPGYCVSEECGIKIQPKDYSSFLDQL